jgi:hypothetical protein
MNPVSNRVLSFIFVSFEESAFFDLTENMFYCEEPEGNCLSLREKFRVKGGGLGKRFRE